MAKIGGSSGALKYFVSLDKDKILGLGFIF
jgi:hypothetical protein